MFWNREYHPDGVAADHVVQRGLPAAKISTESCVLNRIQISYLEILDIEILDSGYSPRKLIIRFRRGGSITYIGPRFGMKNVAAFVSGANHLRERMLKAVDERWLSVLEYRLLKENAVRIDDFMLLDTGEIYENERYLTEIMASDFEISVRGRNLHIQHRDHHLERYRKTTSFDLGLAAAPVAEVVRRTKEALRSKKKKIGWSGMHEKAALAMLALATVVGAWNQVGLRAKVRSFCQKRGIPFDRMNVDLANIDYVNLVLDKRFVRNTFNNITNHCHTPELVKTLRVDHLVDDLIEVAADGNRLSSAALYLIYEIALFQGQSMTSVPHAINRVLKLNGRPWVEVKDPRWHLQNEDDAVTGRRETNGPTQEHSYSPNGSARASSPPPPEEPETLKEEKRWFFSSLTIENMKFFGFSDPPNEKELRSAYASLLKRHHPDRIQMSGTADEIAAATAMMQEINRRRDWLLADLADYWASAN